VACGHRLILGCRHNTGSSTVAALACSPALYGNLACGVRGEDLRRWVDRGLADASSLPPK
jgi:hypothetical protein